MEEREDGAIACPEAGCEFRTESLRKLGRHRSVTHADTKYRCDLCHFVTGYQSNYYRHRKQVHGASGSSQARREEMSSSAWSGALPNPFLAPNPETSALLQQMQSGEGNGELLTAYYLRLAAAAAQLNSGGNAGGQLDPMTALLLQANLQAPLSLQLPTPNHSAPPSSSGKGFVCDECGWETEASREHLHHLRDVHGEVIQITYCPSCDFATRHGPAALASHHCRASEAPSETESEKESGSLVVAEEEAEPKPKLRCDLCPYETEDESRFKKHQRCHKTTAETACRLCDFNTVYSWNLDRHMRSHRTKARYTCLRCSFSQNTRQSITFHLQHHHTVQRVDAETQTDEEYAGPTMTEVEGEAYVFEVHAVRFCPEEVAAASPNSHSPASSASPASPSHFLQKSGFAERFLNRYGKEEEGRKREASGTLEGSGKKTLKLDETAVRKYLSETDAIETPSDERDIKDLENDPDVQTRVCSICGYQGKWISEMIRHKRVHTNERPFKCRYCNRTSKWKADLIRHVAKVHGIRVVSKYSRSKTFDSDAGMMRALKEQHGFVDADPAASPAPDSAPASLLAALQDVATILPNPTSQTFTFRCKRCEWESSEMGQMLEHGQSCDGQPPVDETPSQASECHLCPFVASSELALMAHRKAHQRPTGLFNYKCVFCDWFSKKKSGVEEHMRVHTEHPEAHMEEVERNLITTACPLDAAPPPPPLSSLPPPRQTPEEAENNGVLLPMADVSELVSDFSAIIQAAGGGDLSGSLEGLRTEGGAFPVSLAEEDEAASDEEEAAGYLHAGLDSDAREIRKVSVLLEGKPERVWQCRHCPHVSKRRANVRLHEKKHGEAQDGQFQCQECDYRGDRRSLNAHIRVHDAAVSGTSTPRRLPCPSCPATFRSAADLGRHAAFHGSGLGFRCGRCNYGVDSAASLALHSVAHAEEEEPPKLPTPKAPRTPNSSFGKSAGTPKPKKHVCPSCPARFADTTQLTRHVAFHGVDLAHKCPHCDYSVPFQINLIKHIKAHHGGQLDLNSNALPLTPIPTL